jgi:AcrR family transcriptional regulator
MNFVKPFPIRTYRKDHNRRRLIEAASGLFVEKGFERTGMHEIAKAAGLSRATVYVHFDNKTAIVREVVADRYETLRILCDEFGALEEWSRSTIRAWIVDVFEGCEKYAERTRLDLNQIPSGVMNESPKQLRIYAKAMMRNVAMWRHFTQDEAERRACLLLIELLRSIGACGDGMFVSELELLFDTLSDIWFTTLRADQVQKTASAAKSPYGTQCSRD